MEETAVEGVEKSNERIARSKSWRENNKFNQNEDAGKLYGIEIVEISSQNGHSCANTHNLAQIAIKIKTFDGFFIITERSNLVVAIARHKQFNNRKYRFVRTTTVHDFDTDVRGRWSNARDGKDAKRHTALPSVKWRKPHPVSVISRKRAKYSCEQSPFNVKVNL